MPPLVVAIIQARMGSERLPGKVLLDIEGETMLSRVVHRLQLSQLIDEVVVATSTNPADDLIEAAATSLAVRTTRGSEDDVLGRFAATAELLQPDVCVRVSADSPFVDPEVCDLVIERFLSAEPPVDYASNKLLPTFPLGLDVEAFSRSALERADIEASEAFERSHVTVYMYQHPELFRLLAVGTDRDRHSWRWTVDTTEDLSFARAVFAELGGVNDFSWRDVVELIDAKPELALINAHVASRPISAG